MMRDLAGPRRSGLNLQGTAIPTVLILVCAGMAGCVDDAKEAQATAEPEAPPSFIHELEQADFVTDGPNSVPLVDGVHDVLPVQRVAFPSHDGTSIAAGVWLPDVPANVKVPVILMISPYFGSGLYSEDSRTTQFFHPLVAHGYAFAKVAVRGTSYSEGCMQSFGLPEQQDMDDIVTWFGTQPWSNGNVSIIGVSYVGSTPWAAATHGNPHLKTIVPISGVTDWFQLGFRNGSREPRTPIHMNLYWSQYGVVDTATNAATGTEDPAAVLDNVCEEALWSTVAPEYAALTGEPGPARFAQYWQDRDVRQRVADNYRGSILLIHGLQDWNVNADMAVPFVTELQAAGVEVKWLLGQWGHTWPDSNHDHRRWDFAEQLLRWFDVHLKGKPLDTGAVAEVEDTGGAWRMEATWPPEDATWTRWYLGDATLAPEAGPSGSMVLVNPGGLVDLQECDVASGEGLLPDMIPGTEARFVLPGQDEELRFAGLARVHVTVTPTDLRGGHLYAELLARHADGSFQRLIHGTMNLRFHEGGEEAQTIVPGEPIMARMELFPQDVVVPRGSELILRVVPDASIEPCAATSGEDIIQRPKVPGPDPLPLQLHWGSESSIVLPVIEREVRDGRYPGQPIQD